MEKIFEIHEISRRSLPHCWIFLVESPFEGKITTSESACRSGGPLLVRDLAT